MSAAPIFASTPNRGVALINTANTGRDGSGTLGTVFTAGASGARIDEVRILSTVTTTQGMVRLFVSDGTSHRLIFEQTVPANSVSSSQTGVSYTVTFNNLLLKAGETLRASTEKAEAFVVHAFGGDF